MLRRLNIVSLVGALLFATQTCFAAERFATQLHEIEVTEVVGGLRFPWGMAFLPDGDILVTERDGALRLVRAGELVPEPIAGLPEVAPTGQGGLMGIALDPAFQQEPWGLSRLYR